MSTKNNAEGITADHYVKRGKLQKAKGIAEQMVAKHPGQRIGPELLKIIERNLPKEMP